MGFQILGARVQGSGLGVKASESFRRATSFLIEHLDIYLRHPIPDLYKEVESRPQSL